MANCLGELVFQGGDGSVQALYNGFAGSLHGAGQVPNQHFHPPQACTSVYIIFSVKICMLL